MRFDKLSNVFTPTKLSLRHFFREILPNLMCQYGQRRNVQFYLLKRIKSMPKQYLSRFVYFRINAVSLEHYDF